MIAGGARHELKYSQQLSSRLFGYFVDKWPLRGSAMGSVTIQAVNDQRHGMNDD